ncbi:hypothetical protein T492DRAFT_854310 [Pavlovales sp. CCMP2436]|nr:hypothetical protein T492DRAFT_854310 [Pavlovales sp. CCMP2436]
MEATVIRRIAALRACVMPGHRGLSGRPSHRVPLTLPGREGVSSSGARVLEWMGKKASIRQDMFLLGPPGPELRRLAFRFCELAGREVEYIALTRDSSEPELKQRREIVGGSMVFVDQPPVRAAVYGRVLVLEGVEK